MAAEHLGVEREGAVGVSASGEAADESVEDEGGGRREGEEERVGVVDVAGVGDGGEKE